MPFLCIEIFLEWPKVEPVLLTFYIDLIGPFIQSVADLHEQIVIQFSAAPSL